MQKIKNSKTLFFIRIKTKIFVLLIIICNLNYFAFSLDNNSSFNEMNCIGELENEYDCILDYFFPIDPIKENIKWRLCSRIIPFYSGESEIICLSKDINGKVEIKYKYIPYNIREKYEEYRTISKDYLKLMKSFMESYGSYKCTITEEEYPKIRKFAKKFERMKTFTHPESKSGILRFYLHPTRYEIWIQRKNEDSIYIFSLEKEDNIIKFIIKLQKEIRKIRATDYCMD